MCLIKVICAQSGIKAKKMKTYFCITICLISLVLSKAAFEDCSRDDSASEQRCNAQVRRMLELKDEFFKVCCAEYEKETSVKECPNNCNIYARHAAKDKLNSELNQNTANVSPVVLQYKISTGVTLQYKTRLHNPEKSEVNKTE